MKKLLLLLLLASAFAQAPHQARTLSGVNAQTGTSYTFVGQDSTYLVTFSNTNPVTATMPAGTTNGFTAGNMFSIQNIGPGDVTITCSGCLFYINSSAGAASLLLQAGQGVDLYSSGLNYSGELGAGGGGGSTQNGSQYAIPYYFSSGSNNILAGGQASDDQTNPFKSPHGFDVFTNGAFNYQVPNNGITGTTNLTAACNDGAGNAKTCDHTTATSNVPIGFVKANAGTTGNAIISSLGWISVVMDNTAIAGDWAISSPSVDGELHDTGSTTLTGGQANFYVFTSNAGPGTPAIIELLTPNEFANSGGGGFVNCMTTLGDMISGGVAGVCSRLAGATTPDGVPQVLISVPSGSTATAPQFSLQGITPNPQTGTTYTVLATDRMKMVTFSNGSAIAVTLPQAGSTGFGTNFVFEACDIGVGTATITPTTSTISYTTGSGYTSGASSIALATGKCAKITSDNVNYYATSNTGTGSGSGTVTSVTFTGDGVVDSATPSSAVTASGTVTATIATQSANRVFGNFTSGTAAPTFAQINSGSSCGDSTHALAYTNGTGFVCQAISAGTGTATSVGLSVQSGSSSGIFAITGSPVTTSGTLNFNLSGTSGGHPYFSSSTVLSSTTAQTTHGIWLAQGAGNADTTTGVGTTTTVLHGNASGDPTYGAVVGADMTANTVTATQLAAQYSKGSCTEVWGGSGTSNAMASGDDAIVNNACYNDSGVTRTITAVKCRGDNASNTTVLTPTFGSAGTGTAILTGTLTCGNSYAYSSTGTVTNSSWTTGTGIDPGMSTVGNATSVALIIEYTF